MIFKEDTQKKKNKNRKQNNPKPPKRCRDYENLTCEKKGRRTSLVVVVVGNLGERGELEARKQAATTPQKNTETANRRQREPTSAKHGRLSLSLFLFVAKRIWGERIRYRSLDLGIGVQ
jgi:hypothetical protein